jgi:uncharacterized protein (TIGR02302 family)
LSPEQAEDPRRDDAAGAEAQLARLARRAEAVIVFERLWPPLAWAAALGALFLAVSWFGLWQALPREARIGGVLLFAVALGVALAPLARLRRPTRAEILARVDRDSGAAHRPAASLADRIAGPGDDPAAAALWALHRQRLARMVARFRPAAPAPGMARRDPRALRYAALLAALCAALIAGPERYGRLASAFDWRSGASTGAIARLDAWIDPPAYADKPPILIDLSKPHDATQTIVAPEDSALVVRAEAGLADTRIEGALVPVAAPPDAKVGANSGAQTSGKPRMTAAANAKAKPDARPNAPVEKRWTIRGDGAFSVWRDGVSLGRFVIQAIPAGTPTITLTEPPRANLSGSLTLRYSLADRYGIAGAEAEFAKPFGREAPPRSLVPPPKLTLELPNALNGTGEATTTGDLSEHPWAGAQVVMTLKATGVSGHTGVTPATLIVLPQRQFRNPVARALVEQRRALILDPDHEPPRVAKAIAALTIAPDLFRTPAGVYLGLRDVEARLAAARGDADLLAVADLLWSMALRIEDGDSTQAQRDLRAAEQKLREALQRGASEDELRKLTQDLRDAAERYMRDLAQQGPPRDDNADVALPQQDLEAMLDKMDNLARNGARQDAEAMLDQLQNMFENMRGAPDAQEDAANRELRNQLNELGKLLRDQQALRDDTFRRDQREQLGRNDPPDPNDAGKPSLQDRQQALNDRLAELQKRLKSLGMKGEKGLDDAQGDMSEAEGDLKGEGQGKSGDQGQGQAEGKPQGDGDDGALDGEGRTGKGRAVEAQGRALEALRQGAQGLQQQAQGSGSQGGGYAAGGHKPGQGQGGSDALGRDPLGRDSGDRGALFGGGLNGGPDVAERARRVLEELRRRLADPNRPGEERDYLERLLRHD